MSNIYLEKIALTKEDVRSARVGGYKAGRRIERKGELIGTGLGGALGAVAGNKFAKKSLKDPAIHQALRSQRLTPGKFKAGMIATVGAIGAINGLGIGSAAVKDSAEKARYKEQTRKINQGLNKSAAVTEKQVRLREGRNDILAGLGGTAGAAVGGAAGLGGVAGAGVHKGLKESGGYTAMKNSLKNAYQRRKTEKSIGKGSTLMGKGNAVALSTGNREQIARKTGNVAGRMVTRKGFLGAAAGLIAGSAIASNAVRKRTDASDVSHYKRLSKRNG